MSSVVRVPEDTLSEVRRIAEMQGTAPGELLADAWREYLTRHRQQFAKDLEEAARLLRNGSVEDLADFASRNAGTRARAARRSALGHP